MCQFWFFEPPNKKSQLKNSRNITPQAAGTFESSSEREFTLEYPKTWAGQLVRQGADEIR